MAEDADDGATTADDGAGSAAETRPEELPEEIEARVLEEYDFENFGPAEMAKLSAEEWEAVFDPDTWVTGPKLLDRVEDELRARVADREVFAVVERLDDVTLIAYSDSGYATVTGDGSVEGRGTVLRDVKPTVALCSMPDYEVDEPPEDADLPEPADVPEGGGELGNWMLQLVAFALFGGGLVLIGAALLGATGTAIIIALVAGIGFCAAGVFLFLTVANARLAERFRADEFRNRLRAAGVEGEGRPAFVPVDEEGNLEPLGASDDRSDSDPQPNEETA
jgi:hypothetical protein